MFAWAQVPSESPRPFLKTDDTADLSYRELRTCIRRILDFCKYSPPRWGARIDQIEMIYPWQFHKSDYVGLYRARGQVILAYIQRNDVIGCAVNQHSRYSRAML